MKVFYYLIPFIFITTLISCNKSTDEYLVNAKIIDFNPNKATCQWGWAIQVNNQLIKSTSSLIGEKVGYQFDEPVKALLEIGNFEKKCDFYNSTEIPFSNLNYYNIKQLEIQ